MMSEQQAVPSPALLARRQGVRQQTRPHPQTVTEFSVDHLDGTTPRTRRQGRRKSSNGSPTVHLKVNPQVWKVALKLAKGDPKRIKVISLNEVVVLNNAQPGIILEHAVKQKLRKPQR